MKRAVKILKRILIIIFVTLTLSILFYGLTLSFHEFYDNFFDASKTSNNSSYTIYAFYRSVFGSLLFGILAGGAHLFAFFTLPLIFIQFFFECKNLTSKWLYIIAWIVVGFINTYMFEAIIAGFICGLLYWFFVGSDAGKWKTKDQTTSNKQSMSFRKILGYTALLYFTYVSIGYIWYGIKMIEVSIWEPSRGTPAFVSYREGIRKEYIQNSNNSGGSSKPIKLKILQKVALRDFPDVASCVENDAQDNTKNKLYNLDWDKINNSAEAEVCTFRILTELGGIEHASPWLVAQGFKSSTNSSSSKPFKTHLGKLSVQASYSISKNGPKFPTTGIFRRAFGSIAYSMNVETKWSSDGKTLLYMRYQFNRL